MKAYRLMICSLVVLCVGISANTYGNPIVKKSIQEVIEFFAEKGGKTAAKEFAEFGGESAAREVLEKAFQEGGEGLTAKVVQYSRKYGINALRGMRHSPKMFVRALDDLPDNLIGAALQAVKREPELMAKLTAEYGSKALQVAARHPGVGPQIASKLGKEGLDLALELPTKSVIQLGRLSGPLQKLTSQQRASIIDIIKKAPEKALDLLENHPKVLYTTAGVASFIAAKDQILGDSEVYVDEDGNFQVVDKPGIIGRTVNSLLGTEETKKGIASVFYVIVLIIGIWGLFFIKASIKKRNLSQGKSELKK